MRTRVLLGLWLLLLTGLFGSCKDDPSSSKPPNVPAVTIAVVPDSGYGTVDSATTFMIKVLSGSLPSPHTTQWSFDSSPTVYFGDTLQHTFTSIGKHSVDVSIVNASSAKVAVAHTTIIDTSFNTHTNDTSSHDFTWTEFTGVQGQNNMTGCWVFGPNDIYIVNDKVYHYDGSSWSTVDFYAPYTVSGLSGMSMFGLPDELWLAESGGIFRLTLSTHKAAVWRFPDTATYGWLHSIWGLSSNDLYAVGDKGTILHFDGSNWTKMNCPTTKDLYSICGTSDNNVWACGYNLETQQTVILHFAGAYWSIDSVSNRPPSETGGFLSVWACDSASHHRAYTTGSMLYRKTDANGWNRDSSSLTTNLYGQFVTGSSSNNLFVVGTGGSVLHWNGNSWKRYEQYFMPSDQSYFPHQICMKDGTICIAGFKDYKSWVLIGKQQ
jgi:hypothetical protein